MPEGLMIAGALLQHAHFFRSAGPCASGRQRQWDSAAGDADASSGKLAVGRIALAYAGRIVARPAQPPGTIDTRPAAVATKHGDPLDEGFGDQAATRWCSVGVVAAMMRLGQPAPPENGSSLLRPRNRRWVYSILLFS